MARRSPYRPVGGPRPTHGAHMLTRVLRGVRLDTLDKRSQVACALRKVRDELTAQCGGPDEVTPALALLIEQAAVKAVIAQATGEYILKQECPVSDRHALVAVVMQHDTIQKTLALLLEKIGLERRAKPVADIRQLSGLPD
jgi:hypothetical protein